MPHHMDPLALVFLVVLCVFLLWLTLGPDE